MGCWELVALHGSWQRLQLLLPCLQRAWQLQRLLQQLDLFGCCTLSCGSCWALLQLCSLVLSQQQLLGQHLHQQLLSCKRRCCCCCCADQDLTCEHHWQGCVHQLQHQQVVLVLVLLVLVLPHHHLKSLPWVQRDLLVQCLLTQLLPYQHPLLLHVLLGESALQSWVQLQRCLCLQLCCYWIWKPVADESLLNLLCVLLHD